MGKTHKLQTVPERGSSVARRYQFAHHAPDQEVGAQEIWTIQGLRGGGAYKFLPRAALSLEDTRRLPCQALTSI